MVVYPSNSDKESEKVSQPEQPREKRQPVTKGKVKVKKRNAVTKLADIFLPEDRSSMKEYILEDVIVPYFKKIADDAFHLFLYGRGSSSNSSVSRSSGTYYSSIYDSGRRSNVVSTERKKYVVDDIIFDTRQDAEKVLLKLRDELKTYKMVTVLTLCEFADVPSNPNDYNYGWTDLSSASVVRVRDGYALNLPKPIPID